MFGNGSPFVMPTKGALKWWAKTFIIVELPDQSTRTTSKCSSLVRSFRIIGLFNSASNNFRMTLKTVLSISEPSKSASFNSFNTSKLYTKLRSISVIFSWSLSRLLVKYGSVVRIVRWWPASCRFWMRGRYTIWCSGDGIGRTVNIFALSIDDTKIVSANDKNRYIFLLLFEPPEWTTLLPSHKLLWGIFVQLFWLKCTLKSWVTADFTLNLFLLCFIHFLNWLQKIIILLCNEKFLVSLSRLIFFNCLVLKIFLHSKFFFDFF